MVWQNAGPCTHTHLEGKYDEANADDNGHAHGDEQCKGAVVGGDDSHKVAAEVLCVCVCESSAVVVVVAVHSKMRRAASGGAGFTLKRG